MQRKSILLLSIATVLQAAPATASAQQTTASQPAQPGFMVISQNKCAQDKVAVLDSLARQGMYLVLDELVREGRLLGWGTLTHAWGDEWNFVIYYQAADLAAFDAAWREAIRRAMQRQPTFMTDFARHCTEHKDSMYRVLRMASAGSAP